MLISLRLLYNFKIKILTIGHNFSIRIRILLLSLKHECFKFNNYILWLGTIILIENLCCNIIYHFT